VKVKVEGETIQLTLQGSLHPLQSTGHSLWLSTTPLPSVYATQNSNPRANQFDLGGLLSSQPLVHYQPKVVSDIVRRNHSETLEYYSHQSPSTSSQVASRNLKTRFPPLLEISYNFEVQTVSSTSLLLLQDTWGSIVKIPTLSHRLLTLRFTRSLSPSSSRRNFPTLNFRIFKGR